MVPMAWGAIHNRVPMARGAIHNSVPVARGWNHYHGAYGRVDMVSGQVIICLMVMLYYIQLDSVPFQVPSGHSVLMSFSFLVWLTSLFNVFMALRVVFEGFLHRSLSI